MYTFNSVPIDCSPFFVVNSDKLQSDQETWPLLYINCGHHVKTIHCMLYIVECTAAALSINEQHRCALCSILGTLFYLRKAQQQYVYSSHGKQPFYRSFVQSSHEHCMCTVYNSQVKHYWAAAMYIVQQLYHSALYSRYMKHLCILTAAIWIILVQQLFI